MTDRKAQLVTPLTHQARGAAGRVSDDRKSGLDPLVRFRDRTTPSRLLLVNPAPGSCRSGEAEASLVVSKTIGKSH